MAERVMIHEIEVVMKRTNPGITITGVDSDGEEAEAFLQGFYMLDEMSDFMRYLDEDTREDLENGYEVHVAMYDEAWACSIGEEY